MANERIAEIKERLQVFSKNYLSASDCAKEHGKFYLDTPEIVRYLLTHIDELEERLAALQEPTMMITDSPIYNSNLTIDMEAKYLRHIAKLEAVKDAAMAMEKTQRGSLSIGVLEALEAAEDKA